jgi:hypothetical protein
MLHRPRTGTGQPSPTHKSKDSNESTLRALLLAGIAQSVTVPAGEQIARGVEDGHAPAAVLSV